MPDPGLTELGRTQARALADWFPGFAPHPTQLFSSPFMRALETAAPLAESLGMDVAVRADLMERSGPFVGPIMEHRQESNASSSNDRSSTIKSLEDNISEIEKKIVLDEFHYSRGDAPENLIQTRR